MSMKSIIQNYGRWIGGLAGLVVIMVWAGGGCGQKTPPGRLDHKPGRPVPPGAEIVEIKTQAIHPRVDVVGTAASANKVHLSARIPAYIKEVLVASGDAVKAGQTLIVLDDRDIRQQLSGAEAQLKQAEAEYNRAQQLFATKATTEQALQAAESAYRGAQSQAEQAKVMLSYAQLTSPIDGIITERRIEPGDLANPGQFLMAVYDPRNMRLEVPVPVRLVDHLAMGQEVELALDQPAGTLKGQVTEIVSEIDPGSRTQKVKVQIQQGAKPILPGTFGRVWIHESPHDGIRIPGESVYRMGQLELVQVVENGHSIQRVVRTGQLMDGQVEILAGLKDGERILRQPSKED